MSITEINIYPVKSLGGVSLQTATVENRGFTFDRRWMLIDEDDRFISQREMPQMSRIKLSIAGDMAIAEYGGEMLVLEPPTGQMVEVSIWDDVVAAALCGETANEWFSAALGTGVRLVRMPDGVKRPVDPKYALEGTGDEVSFADAYPYLIIGEASLKDLNSRMEHPVPMNRFRPNLVFSGKEPFAEDDWKKIRIGDIVFHLVKPCARCVITTIDQAEGIKKGPEPLRTLAEFRNVNGKVMFGQNMIAEPGGGVINIGDKIEVLETK